MVETARGASVKPRPLRPVAVAIGILIAIALTFATIRVDVDWPSILAGTIPDDDFAKRYVDHPLRAYLHIAPGVVYLPTDRSGEPHLLLVLDKAGAVGAPI